MPGSPYVLPVPLMDGYAFDPQDQVARTDFEFGASRTRRRTKAQLDFVNVSWLMEDAEFTLFRSWFYADDGAAGGSAWVLCDLALGQTGAKSYEVKFMRGFKPSALSGLNWRVSATLEVRHG